jgi:Bacterial SH3 domain
METKKAVHITWEEAHRAETERDKARQTCCRSIPPNRMNLTAVYVSRDLHKLKASALRLWDVTFNHRVGASGYKGKTLFSPAAVERITEWSKGFPRLVNTICNNALLIAHSAYKQAATAKMLEEKELAQGFQRRVETSTKTNAAGTNSQPLENRHKAEAEEAQRTQFGEDELRESYFKRGPTKSAVAIFLGIILLAGVGTVSYSQQSLSHLAVKWGAIAQRAVRYTSDLEVMVENSKAQPVAPQLSSTNLEPVPPDSRESTAKKARDYLGNFEVVDDSFVRDNPQPNATVIATLRPGTQVRVESKTGEYLRIRSLDDPEVIGYVHEEDAFFQAH